MVDTIISLVAILASLDEFFYWMQVGCKDPTTPALFNLPVAMVAYP
jgi:hypothetical protein